MHQEVFERLVIQQYSARLGQSSKPTHIVEEREALMGSCSTH